MALAEALLLWLAALVYAELVIVFQLYRLDLSASDVQVIALPKQVHCLGQTLCMAGRLLTGQGEVVKGSDLKDLELGGLAGYGLGKVTGLLGNLYGVRACSRRAERI